MRGGYLRPLLTPMTTVWVLVPKPHNRRECRHQKRKVTLTIPAVGASERAVESFDGASIKDNLDVLTMVGNAKPPLLTSLSCKKNE